MDFLIFFREIIGKSSNTKFHEPLSIGSQVVLDGRTDNDDEANNRLSRYYISAKNVRKLCNFAFCVCFQKLLKCSVSAVFISDFRGLCQPLHVSDCRCCALKQISDCRCCALKQISDCRCCALKQISDCRCCALKQISDCRC